MNWHKRLTEAREAKNLKKSAFAKLVGVSAPTVTDWENGDTKMIEGANLVKVCSVLDIAPEWLLHGVNDITELLPGAQRVAIAHEYSQDSYQIPKVKLRLQAGIMGVHTDPDIRDGGTMDVPRTWADREGLRPENLLAIQVKGESMEPTLYEDDIIVINIADKKPVDNGVYAINYEGEAIVKRLSRDAGEWWLMSDNTDQRKYHRKLCRGGECIIVGRVVRRESTRI